MSYMGSIGQKMAICEPYMLNSAFCFLYAPRMALGAICPKEKSPTSAGVDDSGRGYVGSGCLFQRHHINAIHY